MSTFSENAPPVCLFLENPYRLVSLWDMLPFYADAFVKFLEDLKQAELEAKGIINESYTLEGAKSRFYAIGHLILELAADCERLQLRSAGKQVRFIKESLAAGVDDPAATFYQKLGEWLAELRRRVQEDLEDKIFFSITDARIIAEFFKRSEDHAGLVPKRAEEVFDPLVAKRFPNAIEDIDEAVRCLVCDRYSGCMFHLMRVVECGLLEIARLIALEDPKPSWGAILQKIEKLVLRSGHQDIPTPLKPHIVFLRDTLPRLQAVQHAWRNKVSHVEDKLIPVTTDIKEEACWEVFNATKALMRKLASDLP